ncbi:shikimate kinase [Paenibacillus sp. 481]|uniref:shikimate kinase n=1 Tax=Paenibacillus sp. 481 TaxID=2835869 RepID=UPI001E3DC95F|nr:shikimate kinase [Paenibacillus sp. 481]UHA74077.1 shikimate kinase [Paenibacillus sp. 481]
MNQENIILVGFMGTGKSTVGKELARRLNYRFVDLDTEIVEREGCSIPHLFETKGEMYFRDCESAALAELLRNPAGVVIATGGGAVLREANRLHMAQSGWVVGLQAQLSTIVKRVHGDGNRPLLQGDAERRIRQLMAERQGLYDFAHASIPTDFRSAIELADEIMQLLEQRDERC